jgi:protein-disulfide isomerase
MKKTLLAGVAALLMGAAIVLPSMSANAAEEPQAEPKMFVTSPVLNQRKTDHVLGNNNAPVTIIEYASLSCTHCGDFHRNTLPELKKRYIDTGKARLIMRNFPLNDPALKGAVLVNCLEPEQYYTFTKVLFELQDKWAFDENFLQNLQKISSIGGVSADKFNSCISNIELEKQILTDRKEAEVELQLRSTPSFFVNGHRIEGARDVEEFGLMIQKVLNELATKNAPKPDAKDKK